MKKKKVTHKDLVNYVLAKENEAKENMLDTLCAFVDDCKSSEADLVNSKGLDAQLKYLAEYLGGYDKVKTLFETGDLAMDTLVNDVLPNIEYEKIDDE